MTFACAVASTALVATSASADDTIRRPGDHPSYTVEAEPHGLLGWNDTYPGSGWGLGARFSIPVVRNGFIPSINDSVAVTFGADLMFYSACWHVGACSATFLDLPVALQWNFFVANRWSVFGEPGVVLFHGFFNGSCPNGGFCPNAPVETSVEPAIFVGARYHLSDTTSLTMRAGFPSFSFGFSFFL